MGSTGFLFQIIDEKGNILPPNTEGYIGIKIKPTRPLGLFTEYEVTASHLTQPQEHVRVALYPETALSCLLFTLA